MLGSSRPRQSNPRIATRGILRPIQGLERFALTRATTPSDLAPFAPFIWTVAWNLPPGESFCQEVLPFPCVNLAYERGEYRVHGPRTGRFITHLTGQGSVTGVRFSPAGFSAFSRRPMRELVDRVLPVAVVTGVAAPRQAEDPEDACSVLVEYLRALAPIRTPTIALADSLVEKVQADASGVSVAALAAEARVSRRTLHRLFERAVGVSLKRIVRRARVQAAAERVARGARVDWATVAQELGYHDQAHLIRDFRSQVGMTPAAYARSCSDRAAAGLASR